MSDSYCCFTVLPCVCTAHHKQTQIVLIRLIRTHLAGDLALMDNNDTIRKGDNLLQLCRYQQDTGACLFRLFQCITNQLDGTDIYTSGRLGCYQKLIAKRYLPGYYDLLCIAAG